MFFIKLLAKATQDQHNVIVAGVIKHFELAYETSWKFLKEYLKTTQNVDIFSPKAVFRACYSYNILSQTITDDLLELADDRNLTVHIYDQITANEICDSIEKHYKSLGKIIELVIPPQRA